MATDQNLVKEIYEVKTSVAQLDTIVDRLDKTIVELASVSKNISQLIAVQDNRLTTQEKFTTHLLSMVETEKINTANSDRQLEQTIRQLEHDIDEDLDQLKQSILSEIKSMKTEAANSHNDLLKKVTQLEKLVWIATGGGMVIAFIISKMSGPLLKMFQ
jgi:uncharacterized phage infection (PIP) family protein YhgE